MELSPEEKRKIYEEEKARLEVVAKPTKVELSPEEKRKIYEEERARLEPVVKPKKERGYGFRSILILAVILLVGALAWGAVTQVRLSDSQANLSTTKASLVTTQTDLLNANAQLNTTQTRLNNATTEIDRLNSQVNILTADLDIINTQAATSQGTITILQNQLRQLSLELQLYHETGITIYSGIQPAVTDEAGVFVKLMNNPAGQNPTWAQLKSFILADKTDSNPYIEPTYTCVDYARDLHNNAEAAGIRAAFVTVAFLGQSQGHAIDAFVTTDQGLIYIDCTGSAPGQAGASNSDSTVVVKRGTEYQPQLIIPQGWVYLPMGIVNRIIIYW